MTFLISPPHTTSPHSAIANSAVLHVLSTSRIYLFKTLITTPTKTTNMVVFCITLQEASTGGCIFFFKYYCFSLD